MSRVRRNFAKRMKFFEAKSEDTFNANRSRQSSNAHHKNPDDISYLDFYFAFRYESSPSQRLEKKFGGFADGRRERSELVRIARKLSLSELKVQKRNFPSVEQIQDESSNARYE